ncbi:contractile injection system tape measure protein [Vibrio sp. FJH11]
MNKAGKIALNPEPQTHLIMKADFDINFDSARVAEQFEAKVYQWLMHELLPSIDELLSQFCSADTMICIDKLEIDTGYITSENLRRSLHKQVLQQLYQEIYQKTHSDIPTKERTSVTNNAKNQRGGSVDNSITQHELIDYRWQQAWFFIESGQLRWPFKHNQHLSETGLVEVLLNYPARIDNSLSASQNPVTLCLRLAMQLPDESLAQLLPLLNQQNRFLLMIALLETGVRHKSRLTRDLIRYWNSLIDSAISNRNLASLLPYWDRLMTSDSSGLLFAIGKHSRDAQLPLLLIQSLNEDQRFALLERLEPLNYPFLVQLLTSPALWLLPVDTQSMTTLGTGNTVASSQNITHHLWHFTFHYVLVERGSRFNKQQYMKSMIIKMAAMQNLKTSELFSDLRNTLLHIGVNSSLRQQMMILLDDIEPAIFPNKPNSTALSGTSKEASDLSWLVQQIIDLKVSHTLIAHLEQMLTHSASLSQFEWAFKTLPKFRQNLWEQLPATTLKNVIRALTSRSSPTLTFKSKLDLKSTWDGLSNQSDIVIPKTNKSDSLSALLLILQQGNEQSLLHALPEDKQVLKRLLVWIGQLAAVREHWSEHFSNQTLFRFVDIIEPKANEVVHDIFSSRQLIERTTATEAKSGVIEDHALRSSLWQFTLSYLLVQRGSEFNKRSYLLSLTHQIAAHRNVHHRELVRSLLSSLNGQANHHLVKALRSLLPELTNSARKTSSVDSSEIHVFNKADQSRLNNIAAIHTEVPFEMVQALMDANSDQWQHVLKGNLARLDPKALACVIVRLSESNTIRSRWIKNFDEKTLIKLIALTNQQYEAFTFDVLSVRSWIVEAVHYLTNNSKTSVRSSVDRLVWQWLFNAVLSRIVQPFSAEAALNSLLRMLAKHYEIEITELAQAMLRTDKSNTSQFNGSQILVVNLRNVLEYSALQQSHSSPTDLVSLLQKVQTANSTLKLNDKRRLQLREWILEKASAETASILRNDLQSIQNITAHIAPTPQSVESFLPALCYLIDHLEIPVQWLYQHLLSPHRPTTVHSWLDALVRQLKRRRAGFSEQQCSETVHSLIERASAKDIPLAQRQRWLSASTTQDETIKHITNWDVLQSNQLDDDRLELALSRYHHALWKHLTTELQNKDKLVSWIDRLAVHQHFEMFAQQRSEFMPVVISLYQALVFSLGNTPEWKQAFWCVIYHRLLLQGFTGAASQLLQLILNDLTHYPAIVSELGTDNTNDKTKQLASKINVSRQSILVPMLEALSRATSKAKLNTPAAPVELDRSQPQVQRLYDAIEPRRSENVNKPLLWKDQNEKERNTSEPITINNAGLVLSSTYIPTLFQRLNLTDGKAFISEKTKFQALFCLQYMVDGRSEAPEYLLTLNKLLCGVPLSTPIPNQIDLPDGAMSMIDGLLTAMISHWSALGSTSIEGLRTTFLLREGRLLEEEKQWQLNVISGAFDMLLDQIPWSFQTIKYPWMDKPLFVTWR